MRLDTRTLVVFSIVVALVPGLIGALVWQTRRTYPGRWVVGNLAVALSLLCLSLRGKAPDSISVVLANALILAAAITFLQGNRQFRGLRIGWWQESLIGAAALAVIMFFRYVIDDINARILAMSIALVSFGIASGITLLKDMPDHRRTGFIITAIVFILGGVLNLVRGVYVFTVAPITDLFDTALPNSILFFLSGIGVMSWSFGFIVMTNDVMEPKSIQPDPPLTPLPHETVPDSEVRLQLIRIVESDLFRRSTQMVRFLTLIVDRTLSGHSEELKEYALGRDAFHRGDDFDPRTDSIVRVEAQRLRRKLNEYYRSIGNRDPVVIEIQAGSYAPSFRYGISGQSALGASAGDADNG